MSGVWNDIKVALKKENYLNWLIAINVIIFLLTGFVKTFVTLSAADFPAWMSALLQHLALPADPYLVITRPYSLITYFFLHDGFMHILFNMLWLYWMGGLFQEYVGSRKMLTAFVAGGLGGAILYILAYNTIPVLSAFKEVSFCVGASAGVMGIIVGAATLIPDYSIRLFLIGDVKLKWLALAYLALDVIGISNGNAGGHIAHLGGALAGFTYVKGMRSDFQFWKPLEWLLALIFGWNPKKPKLRGIKGEVPYGAAPKTFKTGGEEKLNIILDKISAKGYDSLTKEEKDFLFEWGKKNP